MMFRRLSYLACEVKAFMSTSPVLKVTVPWKTTRKWCYSSGDDLKLFALLIYFRFRAAASLVVSDQLVPYLCGSTRR
jgi:hypothetical protein